MKHNVVQFDKHAPAFTMNLVKKNRTTNLQQRLKNSLLPKDATHASQKT